MELLIKAKAIPACAGKREAKSMNLYLPLPGKPGPGEDITVCQDDVRAVQLGKSALLAGARILMRYAGVDKPDEIILAGAFGSYIDVDDAVTIGLFPDCPREKIRAVGNAAGDGARMALFNWDFREKAQRLEEKTEFVALSSVPDFQDMLVEAMYLGAGG